MRITYGEHKRAYVKDVRVGEQIVQKIMYNGVQVYPDNETRVKKIGLDMRWAEGTEAGVYWQYAIRHSGETSGGSIKLMLGDKEYEGVYEKGVFTFQGDRPLLQEISAGDIATLKIYVPQRKSSSWSKKSTGNYTWEEIWLPGSKVVAKLSGRQTMSACSANARIESMPSGVDRRNISMKEVSYKLPKTSTYKASNDNIILGETGTKATITSISGADAQITFSLTIPEVIKQYEAKITYIE